LAQLVSSSVVFALAALEQRKSYWKTTAIRFITIAIYCLTSWLPIGRVGQTTTPSGPLISQSKSKLPCKVRARKNAAPSLGLWDAQGARMKFQMQRQV